VNKRWHILFALLVVVLVNSAVAEGLKPSLRSVDAVVVKEIRPLNHTELAEQAYHQGLKWVAEGRLSDAEDHLRVALHEIPNHMAARNALAGLLISQNRYAEVRQLLEQGMALLPENGDFVSLLARTYITQGLDDKALMLLEGRVAQATDNPNVSAMLGFLYQRQGKFSEAEVAYLRALKQRPQEGRWWLGLGLSLESTQKRQPAYLAYSHALNSETLPPSLRRYTNERLNSVRNVKKSLD